MHVGDIVVITHSKARILKRKIFRIMHIEGTDYCSKIICRDPWGNDKIFCKYQLSTLENLEYDLKRKLFTARKIASAAEEDVVRLEKEMLEVVNYFPSI